MPVTETQSKASHSTTISMADVCRITGTARDVGKAAFEKDKIESTPGPRNSKLYNLFDAVHCLMKRKSAASAIEQRNLADAKLKEAQRKKLEREWIPLPEARHLAARIASITCEIIEGSDLDLDAQNLLNKRIKDAMQEGLDEEDDE